MPKKFISLFAVLGMLILTGASCIQLGGTTAGPMGVFESTDKAESWKAVSAYPTNQGVKSIAGIKVFRLYNDPSDSNAIYLASRGQGLFYTYDNGQNWQSVPVFNNAFVYGLAVDPTDKCTIYVSDGPHIFKTTDCSRTWKIVYTEERTSERLVSLAIDFGDHNVIYGALLGGDIMVSKDAGKSWRITKRFGFNLQYLTTDPLTPKRIYVASYRNGLFRSDDIGETWTDLTLGLDSFSDSRVFNRLVLNGGQKNSLFWISKYGIVRSDDAGLTWTELKLLTPPGSVNIYAFAINPKNQKEIYYTGTILGEKNVHVRSTFYKSVDGGVNWVTKKLPTNTIPTHLMLHPDNGARLFMGFTTLE